jgi:hypothetical protein
LESFFLISKGLGLSQLEQILGEHFMNSQETNSFDMLRRHVKQSGVEFSSLRKLGDSPCGRPTMNTWNYERAHRVEFFPVFAHSVGFFLPRGGAEAPARAASAVGGVSINSR